MAIHRSLCSLLLFICAQLSLCVDRTNFKTCKQSSFCDRQHLVKEGSLEHRIDPTSVSITAHGLTAIILTDDKNHSLKLQITYFSHSIFNVFIDEVTDEYKRYRVPSGDVILDSVRPKSILATFGEKKVTLAGSNGDKAVVYFDPFFIEFYHDDKNVISINKRSLLYFEHQRIKEADNERNQSVDAEPPVPDSTTTETPLSSESTTSVPDDASPVEHDVDSDKSFENSGDIAKPDVPTEHNPTWSEYFKEHLDSRPHGLNSISMDIDFDGVNHVYGIPEHAERLPLQSTDEYDPYRLFNLDVFEYELNNRMALYGSIPFMWGHSANHSVGAFWLNPSETWIDVGHTQSKTDGIFSRIPSIFSKKSHSVMTRWISESGVVDTYLLLGRSPPAVSKAYAYLTGTTRLPPLFALAYHQCRWNYNDEGDIQYIDKQFDEHRIPVDVLWLDIEHTDGKRYFTWDPHKFPNPETMVDRLSLKGRKLVTVVDPHIKRDSDWALYSVAQKRDVFIKNRDGIEFDGWCWPGSSSWPDFTNPNVRHWWSQLFLTYEPLRKDSMFTWNDMNEPSVFNGPEVTIHKDALHMNNWENRDIHNLYGMYVHRATWEGLLLRFDGTERPFVLTRSVFAGSQRTAAVWTGDNAADWNHLKISIPMILSLSITGMTFSGADVGGFFGNPDPELLTRWYQAGAYQPFFRAHAHLDTKRREPWLVPDEYMRIIRSAISARYNLLPYWYTMFARCEVTGEPVMAPMWYHFPQDMNTFDIDDQHMVGECLLVRPVTDPGVTQVPVYFPKGVWYHNPTFESFKGDQIVNYPVTLATVPSFYRGGCIIPRKERMRRSSWLMRHDPYTLIVCIDQMRPNATGYLYYDDFHSTSLHNARLYQIYYEQVPDPTGQNNHGGRLKLIRQPLPGHTSFSTMKDNQSDIEPVPAIERVVIAGFTGLLQRVTVIQRSNGGRRNVEFTINQLNQNDGEQPLSVVVVRQPFVYLNDHWEMHFVTGKELKEDL